MGAHIRLPLKGNSVRTQSLLHGTFTLGTSGAIASQAGSSATVVKTASKTGRYTVTFDRAGSGVHVLRPVLTGPTDSAFGAGSTAIDAQVRNVSGTSFDIQLLLSTADTDGASGLVVSWAALLSE